MHINNAIEQGCASAPHLHAAEASPRSSGHIFWGQNAFSLSPYMRPPFRPASSQLPVAAPKWSSSRDLTVIFGVLAAPQRCSPAKLQVANFEASGNAPEKCQLAPTRPLFAKAAIPGLDPPDLPGRRMLLPEPRNRQSSCAGRTSIDRRFARTWDLAYPESCYRHSQLHTGATERMQTPTRCCHPSNSRRAFIA